MTSKQVLLAHLREYHPRLRLRKDDTYAKLGRKHAADHHRYTVRSHYHQGTNLGPGDRPPGWYSGEGVVTTVTVEVETIPDRMTP